MPSFPCPERNRIMFESATTPAAHTTQVVRRLSAWETTGTTVTHAGNALQAMSAAGLTGWNIRKVTQTGMDVTPLGVTAVDNPDQVMLVRTDPRTNKTRYLSSVGKGYGVTQNEDQAAVLDTLVAESGAAGLAHVGSLDDGRRTFATMKLPTTMRIGGIDRVDLYLAVFDSHDGSTAFRVCAVPFRVACANQLGLAIATTTSSVEVRHTRNSRITVADIRAKLNLIYHYADEFEAEATRLIDTGLTTPEFREIVETVWPVDDRTAPPRTRANAERRRTTLLRLWTDASTQDRIRGTRWAGLQAVTEYLDHHAPATTPAVRAHRVLTGSTVTRRKQQAFDLLTV
ncbi:DUF932 domain-containing protein [Actinosynnema sp. NPDC023587]|uniref:DUF932 domain-containing protein n=1 Tax=Actinosynnema sp. NPDC023587 TaxID=3154695 RepID=UPI0034014591